MYVDNMLGRLARWLRVIGCNTAYLATSGTPELLIAGAKDEGRIVLSRDRIMVDTAIPVPVFFPSATDTTGQFAEVVEHFGIEVSQDLLMSRCSSCNATPFETITVEEARRSGQVADKVFAAVSAFWRCPNAAECGKVFWEGESSSSS